MELQDRFQEITAQGLGVAAISYDSPQILTTFAERRGIADVPLLSDSDSSVIRAFGIYNHVTEEALGPNKDNADVKEDIYTYVTAFGNPGSNLIGTPHPGTFIVDRDGRVTARFFEQFYRERNTASNIMLKLGTPISGIAGSAGETSHLEIVASQSNPVITVGSRFHLALDIAPKANMHVYAPGANNLGYRVVGLQLDGLPDFLRVLPTDYPPSENYYFEPLDETAPVYMQPFQLIQEIVVGGSLEDAEKLSKIDVLTLTGQIGYQACDDKVCYNPVSVPLTWSLTVAPLDRQRAR